MPGQRGRVGGAFNIMVVMMVVLVVAVVVVRALGDDNGTGNQPHLTQLGAGPY